MNTLLWIDDERRPPEGFTHWARTSQEAIDILSQPREGALAWVSFDHDLSMVPDDGHPKMDDGEPYDDARRVVKWMIENNVWPELAMVHSMNPIGATWLFHVLSNKGPENMKVLRMPYNPRNYA